MSYPNPKDTGHSPNLHHDCDIVFTTLQSSVWFVLIFPNA